MHFTYRKALAVPLFLILFFVSGCSWTVRFYIVNDTAKPRQIEIILDAKAKGLTIFNPRAFMILAWRDEALDFSDTKPAPQQYAEKMRIEIPAHSALEIGALNNQNYESSQQSFINGRVFNLIQITAGKSIITRETFDAHFKKMSGSYVWRLPPE